MPEPKKFFIAGVKFHQLSTVLDKLEEGMELDLIPEPDNKFDPNAVRIEYDDHGESIMLGYVPKKFAAEVGALIETSEMGVTCIVSLVDKTAKTWEQCEVIVKEFEEPESEDDTDDLDFKSDEL